MQHAGQQTERETEHETEQQSEDVRAQGRSVRVAALLFPDITQLDLTGPAEVFAASGWHIDLVWKTLDPVVTDGGWTINPTATFESATAADVFLIPGGGGVDPLLNDLETIEFVREQAAVATTVTAVCTGSLVLGAAGLLQGKRATSHWTSRDLLTAFGAEVVPERWVRDGNVWTAGGVSAGIDMALALVGALSGEETVAAAQVEMEYDPQPPYPFGDPKNVDDDLVRSMRDEVQQRRRPLIREASRRLAAD